MTIHELQGTMSQDQYFHQLMGIYHTGWPDIKTQLPQDIRTCWMFRDDMAVIDEVV